MTPRPLLYVIAPWATRTPEEEAATRHAVRVAISRGWAPLFAPWALREVLAETPQGRAVAFECDATFLNFAAATLVVGERITEGMAHDISTWEDGWEPSGFEHTSREPFTLATLPRLS